MRIAIFAGAASALALLTPAFAATSHSKAPPAPFEIGALRVEQTADKGPPLIFIPGLASGSWTWKDSADRLGAGHAVYLLTLPGFDGRQSIPGTTLETLAHDLQKLIET